MIAAQPTPPRIGGVSTQREYQETDPKEREGSARDGGDDRLAPIDANSALSIFGYCIAGPQQRRQRARQSANSILEATIPTERALANYADTRENPSLPPERLSPRDVAHFCKRSNREMWASRCSSDEYEALLDKWGLKVVTRANEDSRRGGGRIVRMAHVPG